MTLSTTEPTDQRMVSELPAYIRENRVSINALAASASDFVYTQLSLTSGTTSLSTKTNVSTVEYESIYISGVGVSELDRILYGTAGQIKVFIFKDNEISLLDGTKDSGKFYLNQLPALTSFSGHTGDTIAFINIDGDGTSVHGWWQELWRKVAIK